MEKGLIGGALLVALFSWAPFESSLPLLVSIKTTYAELVNRAAEMFLHWGW